MHMILSTRISYLCPRRHVLEVPATFNHTLEFNVSGLKKT